MANDLAPLARTVTLRNGSPLSRGDSSPSECWDRAWANGALTARARSGVPAHPEPPNHSPATSRLHKAVTSHRTPELADSQLLACLGETGYPPSVGWCGAGFQPASWAASCRPSPAAGAVREAPGRQGKDAPQLAGRDACPTRASARASRLLALECGDSSPLSRGDSSPSERWERACANGALTARASGGVPAHPEPPKHSPATSRLHKAVTSHRTP